MTTKPDYRVPNAKLILRADATLDEWLDTRATGLGGSDVAYVVGASKYKSPFALWQEKTGRVQPDTLTSHQVRHGSDVEEVIARWFTEDTGIATRKVGTYADKKHPWMRANPDRLTADGGILEIKTTGAFTDKAKTWRSGEVPDDAYVQSQWYLAVTGRSHAWLAAEVDNTDFIVIGPIDRDEELITEITATAADFWAHVESDEAPPLDPDVYDSAELNARYPQAIDPDSTAEIIDPDVEEAIETLAEVKILEAEIKERKADAEKKVKAAIGDKEFLTLNGRPVAKWSNVAGRRSFNQAAVIEKLAADRGVEATKQNLDQIKNEFTTQGEPSRRFTLITEKAA